MKRLTTIAVLILISAALAFSQSSKAEQELLKANQEYDAAIVGNDVKTLERIFADEFVFTDYNGEVKNKAQQLDFFRSGALKLESGESDDVEIRLYKNVAVMTGRFTARRSAGGKKIEIRERYTAVWVKQKGRWRLVAEHGSLEKEK